ncbi:MAG: hypothetical protein H0X45_12435, partial [Planctomycetes bacterium]|nr:hypothetical protein [Planctomycetota bacterium]
HANLSPFIKLEKAQRDDDALYLAQRAEEETQPLLDPVEAMELAEVDRQLDRARDK